MAQGNGELFRQLHNKNLLLFFCKRRTVPSVKKTIGAQNGEVKSIFATAVNTVKALQFYLTPN